ncbi:5017_t:CDS:2, partial [Funneliformis geosporum]
MESSENLNNDYSVVFTGGGFISKDRKNEDEIIFIFHVHMPENIDKIGQPVVLGDGQELGFWEQPNIKLHQPLPQSPTYWRSDSVKISVSITTEGYDIQYKYAICEKESEKNILEGNSNRENRTLDIMRIDQFGIWKNTYDLPNKFRLFPKYIRDFAFVDYIYNSVNVNNLKDKVLEYQYLLSIYNELTIRVSEPNFIINHIDDKLREKRLFSCLLLGYYVSRQNTIYELPNQFPSDLLLDALEGYKQEVLPSDTKDPMYNAITTLIHHNAFKMQFNWLKVFTIDVVVESNYMFIDRLRTLKYPNNHLLTKFIEEVKVVMPYIDNHKFEKLAKWLIELCQDMDGLLKLWSDVLSCREVNDKNILKCFIDRIQENISVDDAVALANHFKDIPKIFRENVSSVFRDRVFLLLSSPSSKWTNPNIFAIQNLLRNGNLNWRSDDAIISMELISQSNNFELLNIFPEILDDWFRREFSDSKKKIPIIC